MIILCQCHLTCQFVVTTTLLFLAAFPLPCLSGCLCYYSIGDEANTMRCSHRTNLSAQILPRTEQLVMTGSILNNIDTVNENFIQIKMFDFQDSNITHISDNVLRMLAHNTHSINFSRNKLQKVSPFFSMISAQTKLWLGNNLYDCNCDMMWMRDWLLNATNVMDKDNITCGPGKWQGTCVFTFKVETFG